ncbi:hypothetical protein [Moorella sulfitireducens (nom. illeg.)]|uniref:hypothetical protein n=1 Tax=Neomoorella sulfitireducens TaxID=2972948 RepID=UPI0021ABCF54|nr:hypothetical protein [Moorella sulfitireducens]
MAAAGKGHKQNTTSNRVLEDVSPHFGGILMSQGLKLAEEIKALPARVRVPMVGSFKNVFNF